MDGVGTNHGAAFRDAALQLWADAGWAAVTVPAVCAATGLTEKDFLATYDTTDDLLCEVFDEGSEERGALVLTSMETVRQGRIGQIRAALEALADYFTQDPRQVVVLAEAIGCPPLRARRRATNRGFGALMAAEADRGGPEESDPTRMQASAQFCIAGFQELVLSWWDPESPVDRDTVVEHAARLIEAVLTVR